jgi:Ca2+-binding EF-hand superfamily protein
VQEIEEMIVTVDKNQDGKISYSEFRVGADRRRSGGGANSGK